MESLGIDIRLIIIQIINFGLLFFVLTKFLYRPILKMLDERKNKIAENISREQKLIEEKEKFEEEKKSELKKTRDLGVEIIKEAKEEAEKEKDRIVKKAQEEADRSIQRAKDQLVLDREKLHGEIKKELGDLSITIAEKFLEEKLARREKDFLLSESLETFKKGARSSVSLLQIPLFEKKKISPQAEKIAAGILTILRKTQNLKLLPQILEKLESSFTGTAEIITATPLKPEDEQKARQVLEDIYGKNLKILFRVNSKIVGGMIVKVGDKIFDSSLLGKASQLRDSI